MLQQILSFYNVDVFYSTSKFGSGLINDTWLVKGKANDYILQKINEKVFTAPEDIAENISSIADYLLENQINYPLVNPISTAGGQPFVRTEDGCFRLFVFVPFSHTINVANNVNQAYEAARQFGLFTKAFAAFPANALRITLPDFHNLSLRYNQFNNALLNGDENRIAETKKEITFLEKHATIVLVYEKIISSSEFITRVAHHDTKISNVLFIEDSGYCVIDLDTVMPGYFISDVGDMLRTYLSPVSEEEKDTRAINIRADFFKAIAEGYLAPMHDELTKAEIDHFYYSGLFMIYMQALRFLTDYLNNDEYYGASYPKHNLVRARNQLALLAKYLEKEDVLKAIVAETVEKIRSKKK